MSASARSDHTGPILAGLSAHNEGQTVGHVAEEVARGLKGSFPDRESVLVLADSCSTDDTVSAFTSTHVDVATCVRDSDAHKLGKGRAVRSILREAVDRGASVVVLIDADLRSVRSDWVTRLVTPVFEGVDLVEPEYLRAARDGAVTTHFSHPFVLALTGLNIRQPTGGEFAMSGELAKFVVERRWPDGACGYGIDMFATLVAALRGARIASARLGIKVHRPNPAKLAQIFCDVASTAMSVAAEGAFPLEDAEDVTEIETFGEHVDCCAPPGGIHVESFAMVARSAWAEAEPGVATVLPRDVRAHIGAALERDRPSVDVGLWHECLAQGVRAARSGADPEVVAKALVPAFIARSATFSQESSELSPGDTQHATVSDALRFRGILRATPGTKFRKKRASKRASKSASKSAAGSKPKTVGKAKTRKKARERKAR